MPPMLEKFHKGEPNPRSSSGEELNRRRERLTLLQANWGVLLSLVEVQSMFNISTMIVFTVLGTIA